MILFCIFIEPILTAVTALVTFITALATLLTVKELKKQREQSNMPNLVLLPNKKFYAYSKPPYEELQFSYWHEEKLNNLNEVGSKRSFEFYIDMFNIGVGSAKNVKFHYSIDKEEVKNTLTHLGVTINNLDLKGDKINFSVNTKYKNAGTNIGKNDLIFEEIFIPKTEEQPFKLKLPTIYLSLFNVFLLCIHEENNFPNFPPLSLSVNYQDIANKTYKKDFEITLKTGGKSINTERAPTHFSGTIEIREK